MKTFDVAEIRGCTKELTPSANFDGAYTFYYDETNNAGKFYVRELDFNSPFIDNFVLGGLVHEGLPPDDVPSLINGFQLQSSVKEVKFKHVAKGSFLDCIRSQKLNRFLKYINSMNMYIHYSSVNILYWSIVDIVDSAIAHSEASQQLGFDFANLLKNDLYKLARREIKSVHSLFFKYGYPNIKHGDVISFVDKLCSLFADYIDNMEFHLGLESLRQILKVAKKKGSLPFVMDEEDNILLKDFSSFYLHRVYMFKNSRHIFDNENTISRLLSKYAIVDGDQQIRNYSFVDSATSQLTQLSDVVVGLIGKLHRYLNTKTKNEIHADFSELNPIQKNNIDLLLTSIDRSHAKNMGFLHSVDSYEEMSKVGVIRAVRIDANSKEEPNQRGHGTR